MHGRRNDPNHAPVDLYEAARATGYRHKAVRLLFRSAPVFVTAYNAEQAKCGAPALTVKQVWDFITADLAMRNQPPVADLNGPTFVAALKAKSVQARPDVRKKRKATDDLCCRNQERHQ